MRKATPQNPIYTHSVEIVQRDGRWFWITQEQGKPPVTIALRTPPKTPHPKLEPIR